jgi:hypothetical protein
MGYEVGEEEKKISLGGQRIQRKYYAHRTPKE